MILSVVVRRIFWKGQEKGAWVVMIGFCGWIFPHSLNWCCPSLGKKENPSLWLVTELQPIAIISGLKWPWNWGGVGEKKVIHDPWIALAIHDKRRMVQITSYMIVAVSPDDIIEFWQSTTQFSKFLFCEPDSILNYFICIQGIVRNFWTTHYLWDLPEI